MKKKRKKYQTVQPIQEPAPEPKKVIPISAGRVQINDIVTRKSLTLVDKAGRMGQVMCGRVIWIHPRGRFHVVEFGVGQQTVRESFMGVGFYEQES